MIQGPKKTVCVLLPEEIYLELRSQAGEAHRSLPGYIRQILKRYLRYRAEQGENMEQHWIIR